jgi:hypothetical protein
MVPPVDLVADFLAAAIAEQLPFKATAGLHHPVRHFNHADGWVHHGFLNVQGGAVLLAARAIDEADLPAVIAETDPSAFTLTPAGFAWGGHAVDAAAIIQARALVHGHGSCSFAEPVEDLTALGILAEGANGQV